MRVSGFERSEERSGVVCVVIDSGRSKVWGRDGPGGGGAYSSDCGLAA